MPINVYIGYDPRESSVYHVCSQSIIDNTTDPVQITPLHQDQLRIDGQQDGTNAFIYSRYLVPHIQGFKGWAIFMDGDMVVKDDLAHLWSLRDDKYAVMVVKHDYQTSQRRKYLGTPMESDNLDYPCKNWSSVMLINCGHPSNKILSPQVVSEAGGRFLHRFQWLNDDEIGELPMEWNWLVGEYDPNPDAKLLHYTLGVPGFYEYMRCDHREDWNAALLKVNHLEGERPEEVVRRATWRSHGSHNQLRDVANGNSRHARAV